MNCIKIHGNCCFSFLVVDWSNKIVKLWNIVQNIDMNSPCHSLPKSTKCFCFQCFASFNCFDRVRKIVLQSCSSFTCLLYLLVSVRVLYGIIALPNNTVSVIFSLGQTVLLISYRTWSSKTEHLKIASKKFHHLYFTIRKM